jgi:hypothetical protein
MATFSYACECDDKTCRRRIRMTDVEFGRIRSSTRRLVSVDCPDAFIARRRGLVFGVGGGYVLVAAKLGQSAVAA